MAATNARAAVEKVMSSTSTGSTDNSVRDWNVIGPRSRPTLEDNPFWVVCRLKQKTAIISVSPAPVLPACFATCRRRSLSCWRSERLSSCSLFTLFPRSTLIRVHSLTRLSSPRMYVSLFRRDRCAEALFLILRRAPRSFLSSCFVSGSWVGTDTPCLLINNSRSRSVIPATRASPLRGRGCVERARGGGDGEPCAAGSTFGSCGRRLRRGAGDEPFDSPVSDEWSDSESSVSPSMPESIKVSMSSTPSVSRVVTSHCPASVRSSISIMPTDGDGGSVTSQLIDSWSKTATSPSMVMSTETSSGGLDGHPDGHSSGLCVASLSSWSRSTSGNASQGSARSASSSVGNTLSRTIAIVLSKSTQCNQTNEKQDSLARLR
mmetsp:Transcript_76033/g.105615  ORF Transcript_76033/g.105615 Transcript_76033/m.105615 type:complete len:377 (-) Transcript_76033:77-1207(-)